VKFELDQKEAAFVVRAIGQLPTESGAHPLWQKLLAQFNEQQTKEEALQ
jgi:hypothetical protein